jgi:shikimate kinase
MTRHVVLVGLMGSGKTTVGRRLAAALDRDFIDADEALEEIADRTIAEIFEADGEAAFRAIEADVLEELLEHHRPAVIASGGGVVLREDSRQRLRGPEVTVVWLDAGPAFLASRVEAKSHRPLLAGEAPARDVLARLHAERAPLYEAVADLTVQVEPFHRDEEKPKKALAARIADLVLAHEAGTVAEGAAS